MRLRRRLRWQPRPAGPLTPARRDRPGPPRPSRLLSARRPQAAPGSRALGAFVLSKTAAQGARELRADDLRPRCLQGASWSQIRCRNGRSVGHWCERVARPKTAAWIAASAAHSLLPCTLLPTTDCSLLSTIARHCSGGWGGAPEQVSAHRPPFSVDLTSSAVSWEIPGVCAESRVCGRPHEARRWPQLPSPCGPAPSATANAE